VIESPYVVATNVEYVKPIPPIPPKPVIKRISSYCSCVTFVKSVVGYDRPVGWARSWPKNSEPEIGGVVVQNIGKYGHVAVIEGITGNTLYLVEANYKKCRLTRRTMQITDPSIMGFWSS